MTRTLKDILANEIALAHPLPTMDTLDQDFDDDYLLVDYCMDSHTHVHAA